MQTTTKHSPLSNGNYEEDSITINWKNSLKTTDFSISNNDINKGQYFAFALSEDEEMVI